MTFVELVRQRARHRCEYCRLPRAVSAMPFELEHVVPHKHGGSDALGNRAFSCIHCNRHKGSDLAGFDRATSRTKLVRLFNPRKHVWNHHFSFNGARLVGKTSIGRVTIKVLNMNDPLMIAIREELMEEGAFTLH
jgi:hypothetical protein